MDSPMVGLGNKRRFVSRQPPSPHFAALNPLASLLVMGPTCSSHRENALVPLSSWPGTDQCLVSLDGGLIEKEWTSVCLGVFSGAVTDYLRFGNL